MNKIILLMPYFGRWPEWFFVFLETCKWNPSIDWIFFTDCGDPGIAPPNVRFVHMSFKDMQTLVSEKLGRPVKLNTPYKICDLRLSFGKIFEEFTQGYDFWGFGDVDVVYGSLREALKGDVLSHDIISFHRDHVSGHLSLFRNNEATKALYRRVEHFELALDKEEYLLFDELLFPNGKPYWDRQRAFDPVSLKSLSIYAAEAFSTPFSLAKPWTNGTFRFPSEWTWKDGRLSNDIDAGREFPYLHFMHWKVRGGTIIARGKRHWRELRRLVYLDPVEIQNGFSINCYGFHPIGKRPKPDFIDSQWKLFFRRTTSMITFQAKQLKATLRKWLPRRGEGTVSW